MIQTIDLTTTIEFAEQKENAVVSLHAKSNKLTIQELAENSKYLVGEIPKDEDIKELPKVVLTFHTIESIDTLIKNLECVKNYLKSPNYTIALAC